MSKLSLVFHTVRHLRACQITGQICERIRSRFETSARLLEIDIPPFESCRWGETLEILPSGEQMNSAEELLQGRMTFLNATHEVGWMPDWTPDNLPLLWRYNLHYFEWLWALDYKDAKAVYHDWIENHRPEKGQDGWLIYPLSLRLINLCGVFCGKFRAEFEGDKNFQTVLWSSIFCQTEWLMGHLETHLLGNHYFENGAALAFVGSCFEGEDARRWYNRGVRILDVEVPEQVLSCGVHFELSPMYHCRILYLLGILSATCDEGLLEIVKKPQKQMVQALRYLCHPDGQIALLKDSSFGIYNLPEQLITYCSDGKESQHLQPPGGFQLSGSGFYGWRAGSGDYVICSFGKSGADYQPAHAHADMLSYELSLGGNRVIVDSGVHDYEVSEFRRYSRSTAAHNTVEVNGEDQCEMWGNFRMARRGYPRDVRYQSDDNGFTLFGFHTGYRRLKGRPIHARQIGWDAQKRIISVQDKVSSGKAVSAVSRIHLHPDCSILERKENRIVVEYPQGMFEIEIHGSRSVSVEKGWYFPEFGKKFENQVIEICAGGEEVEFGYEVRSLDSANH